VEVSKEVMKKFKMLVFLFGGLLFELVQEPAVADW
jgi:hypothetical protein